MICHVTARRLGASLCRRGRSCWERPSTLGVEFAAFRDVHVCRVRDREKRLNKGLIHLPRLIRLRTANTKQTAGAGEAGSL